MNRLKVTETFNLIGKLPSDLHDSLVRAVKSVPQACFFDEAGEPLKKEIVAVDKEIAITLNKYKDKYKWDVEENCRPVLGCSFNVDLAIPRSKVLIEIEKGKLPRLELDILKVASACHQCPKQWHFGALIVPSSYIELPLAGCKSPYRYLQHLAHLIKPFLATSLVRGFLVIGYDDPRSSISS